MLFYAKFKLVWIGGWLDGWLGGSDNWKYSHLSLKLGLGLGLSLAIWIVFKILVLFCQKLDPFQKWSTLGIPWKRHWRIKIVTSAVLCILPLNNQNERSYFRIIGVFIKEIYQVQVGLNIRNITVYYFNLSYIFSTVQQLDMYHLILYRFLYILGRFQDKLNLSSTEICATCTEICIRKTKAKHGNKKNHAL